MKKFIIEIKEGKILNFKIDDAYYGPRVVTYTSIHPKEFIKVHVYTTPKTNKIWSISCTSKNFNFVRYYLTILTDLLSRPPDHREKELMGWYITKDILLSLEQSKLEIWSKKLSDLSSKEKE